jgi:hypothetical protein
VLVGPEIFYNSLTPEGRLSLQKAILQVILAFYFQGVRRGIVFRNHL